MNRATKLHSLFPAALAVIAFTAVTAIGCAAPIVPATNVVVDADVRNCSPSIFDAIGPLDVAIVIDTSQSTRRPTGFDIDQDGSIHRLYRNNAVDRGDSWLAAQIAAVRSLLRNAAGRDIHFSIVTFSGPSIERTVGRTQLTGSVRDSQIQAELTGDMLKLDSVLTEVFEAGSDGKTIFFAGMQRATRSLIESRDEKRRKVVLFMSDSPRPNSLDLDGNIEKRDPRMKNAAVSARGHDVVFHTFGLSWDSGSWRQKSLGRIAGATGGTYHPNEDPRQLYCHLAVSLLPPYQREQRVRRTKFAMHRERQAATQSGELSREP